MSVFGVTHDLCFRILKLCSTKLEIVDLFLCLCTDLRQAESRLCSTNASENMAIPCLCLVPQCG